MEQVCRTCKSSSITLVNIFTKLEHLKDEPPLADILNECVNCDISQNDPLPQNICLSCILSAQDAFRFKRRCEESNQYFCQLLSENKEKNESDVIMPEDCLPIVDYIKIEPLDINDEDIFEVNASISSSQSNIENREEPDTNKSDTNRKYVCITCGKGFNYKSVLTKHMRIHTGERPYKCIHCPMAFKYTTSFQLHTRLHTGERPYKCSQCEAAFIRNDALKKHMLSHTDKLPHECPHCSKKFNHQSNLKRHILIHSENRDHKCSHCSMAFINLADHAKHICTHAVELPYKCSKCPKAFKTNVELSKHDIVHGQKLVHRCPNCPKAYAYSSHLIRHMKCHSRPQKFGKNVPQERPRADSLEDRCQSSLSLDTYQSESLSNQPSVDVPYKKRMEQCNSNYSKAPKKKKNHHCTRCSKVFKKKSHLIEHVRIHTHDFRYKCEHCPRDFVNSSNLKKHLLMHTRNLAFKCSGCSCSFKRKGDLLHHSRKFNHDENIFE